MEWRHQWPYIAGETDFWSIKLTKKQADKAANSPQEKIRMQSWYSVLPKMSNIQQKIQRYAKKQSTNCTQGKKLSIETKYLHMLDLADKTSKQLL